MFCPLRALVPLALASTPLAAQAPPDYEAGEDVAVAGSTAVPLAGPRSDLAVRSDVQGGRLIALGGSYGFPLGSDRVATVSAVEDDGGIAWTWANERHDEAPLGLFAPANGTGAFVSMLRSAGSFLDETLVAVRVDGGREAWRAELSADNLPSHSLAELAGAEDGSRLFLVAERGNLPDLVVALSPATGAPVWSRELATTTDPLAIATDAAGSAVYVLQAGKTALTNDRVSAFDGVTGADLWTAGLPLYVGEGQPLCIAAAPDGSLVVVGFDPAPGGDDLVALERDGSGAWSTSVGGRVRQVVYDPVASDVLAIAQEEGVSGPLALRVHAVRTQNGAVKWSAPLEVPTYLGKRVAADLDAAGHRLALYYDASPVDVLAPDTGVLTWLDLANDGAVLFHEAQPLPAGQFLRLGGVGVLAGGSRVVRWSSVTPAGQQDEDFEAVGFQGDGAFAWTAAFGVEATAPAGFGVAAPAGGPSVFALLRDSGAVRELAAIDRTSAALAWQVELPPAEEISLAFDPGRKVAASADGALVVARRLGLSTSDPAGLDGVDGASGALLWSKSYLGFGSANDLVVAQPVGAGGPVLFASHGPDTLGRTAMRAVDGATGATLWAEGWPTGGFDAWESATLAVDEPGGRVLGLVGSTFPDELRVLERDAATGALISSTALEDDDFAPGVELGVPRPSDVVLSADGSVLYVLGRYLGTLVQPEHLAVAALDTATWSTRWARAVQPGLELLTTPGRLVLSGGGATLGVASGARHAFDVERVVVLGLDAATGATEWQRTLGVPGDPRVLLDAVPGADPRTIALALGRADGVGEALTLDLATGAPLFAVTADTPSGGDRIRALASSGGATFALVDATTTVPGGAATVARLEPDALVSGPDATSLAAPEPAVFLLDRPASSAGHLYLVAGSATGTTPGIPYGGVVVPLVADPYLLATLNHASQPPFLDTLGVLDAAGDGRATLAVPAGLDPSLVGVTLYHAFVELTAGFAAAFASEPVTLELVD